MSLPSHIWGSMYILCAGLAFSVVNALAQYVGFVLGYPATGVGLVQYAVAFLVLLPWFLRAPRGCFYTQRPFWHVIRVLFAIAGIQLWLKALAWPVPIWQGIALLTTSPLFATIGAGLFLRERISTIRIIACVVGFMGAMMILAPWQDNFSSASLLPLAAAVCWASYALMVKKQTVTESPQALLFYLMLGLLPMNGLLAVADWQLPDMKQFSLLVVSGALTALANYAVIKAYLRADAAYIQPFDFAKIPLNVGIGWLVFSWFPPGYFWFGLLLILGAICLLWSTEHFTMTMDKKRIRIEKTSVT